MKNQAEELAQMFHETYERLAPDHGYETRKDSAVAWESVPEKNKSLMIAVCQEIIDSGFLNSSKPTEAEMNQAIETAKLYGFIANNNEKIESNYEAALEFNKLTPEQRNELVEMTRQM